MTVTGWTGSVGGFVMSQSVGGNKPDYVNDPTNADYQLMGGPTIVFRGVNDELSRFGLNDKLATLPKSSSAWSVLAYQHLDAATAGIDVAWGWGDKGNLRYMELRHDATTEKFKFLGQSVGIELSGSITGSAGVATYRDDGTTGLATLNTNTGSQGSVFAGAALDTLTFGARGLGSKSLYVTGAMSEFLVVDRSLSNIEIEGYNRHILKTYLNPVNISGLRHRWIASSGIETNSSFDVVNWEDSVGGARAGDAFADPFSIHYDQPGRFNGQPFVSGSAITNDIVGNALDVYQVLSGSHTIFAVAERSSTGTLQTIFDMYNITDSNANRAWVYFQNNDWLYYRLRRGGVLEINAVGNVTGQSVAEEKVYAVCVAYDVDAATNNVKFHVNGVTNLKSHAVGIVPVMTGSDVYKLYGRQGGNQPSAGAEIMIYDRVLTDAEMQRLTSYARLKYGNV